MRSSRFSSCFDPLTAAAMSLGGAAIGSGFSPINPFQVGQKLALPLWGALLGLGVVAIVAGIALGLR